MKFLQIFETLRRLVLYWFCKIIRLHKPASLMRVSVENPDITAASLGHVLYNSFCGINRIIETPF